MKIDVHTHYYPPGYLKALEASGRMQIVPDREGRRVIQSEGARIVTLTPAMEDIDLRMADMDRDGIDVAVLSISIPNLYFTEGIEAKEIARVANDSMMELVRRQPKRLTALASVPLQDPGAAIEEMQRALDRGMVGVVLGTHIEGLPLTDKRFSDFFAACDRRHVSILLHPMAPRGAAHMTGYALAPLVGFTGDTSLTAAGMLFDGFPLRYPNIHFILPHLGGTLPYLAGRLDIGYHAYSECRRHLPEPPSHYLSWFHYDTVSYHPAALRCAIETAGADRIVFASDYPHVIGDAALATRSIESLNLTPEQRRGIFFANAAALFGLHAGAESG